MTDKEFKKIKLTGEEYEIHEQRKSSPETRHTESKELDKDSPVQEDPYPEMEEMEVSPVEKFFENHLSRKPVQFSLGEMIIGMHSAGKSLEEISEQSKVPVGEIPELVEDAKEQGIYEAIAEKVGPLYGR